MKQECDNCGGSGEVACCCCDGSGMVNVSLLSVNIKAIRRLDDEDAEELHRLQQDAQRCQVDAIRLKQLNPKASESYDRQLASTLKELESKAEKILQ